VLVAGRGGCLVVKIMTDKSELVGEYDWEKGGSEKYTQELSLKEDGTAFYKESGESRTDSWTRSGAGTWRIEDDIVWVLCAQLTKEVKMKSNVPIPGFKDETKVDYNIGVDVKIDQLKKAPVPPAAPKNRWRRKM